jgi:hypothetical protein
MNIYYLKLDLLLSALKLHFFVSPGRFGGEVQEVWDGKPPGKRTSKKGFTSEPNFSGVTCRLRQGTRHATTHSSGLREPTHRFSHLATIGRNSSLSVVGESIQKISGKIIADNRLY